MADGLREEVFCLRRSDLDGLFGGVLPQGSFVGPALARLLSLPQYFLPRSQAEQNPAFKQLIPYQLFAFKRRFFVYQRGGRVGESRLSGRLSVGLGGHINRIDCDLGQDSGENLLSPATYQAALSRELREEMVNAQFLNSDFVGWINDDASPVGRVHLGAVHLGLVVSEADCRALGIRAEGEDLEHLGWWSLAEILAQAEQFEQWSLLALELVAGIDPGERVG